MRMKRENDIFTIAVSGKLVKPPDNFLVTRMHAIKRAGGKHGVFEFGKIFDASEDSHVNFAAFDFAQADKQSFFRYTMLSR